MRVTRTLFYRTLGSLRPNRSSTGWHQASWHSDIFCPLPQGGSLEPELARLVIDIAKARLLAASHLSQEYEVLKVQHPTS
eukprot:scaffold267445_cov24-Prasinocladus_malaysianus.AAC.1